MRIGIFGGSFNPVHIGHGMVANYLSQSGLVDCVWLMVNRINPLKVDSTPAPFHCRLEMCRIVAEECTGVEASDFELSMPEPSYTVDTLKALTEKYPEHEFSLIIGSDNWLLFDQWKDWKEILNNYRIIVYPRPGYDVDPAALPDGVVIPKDAPQALISSTFIREAMKEKKNLNYFIPSRVLEYINKENLYE